MEGHKVEDSQGTIYTIGHSTRSWDEFLKMLRAFQIQNLVDVRRFPGSRKFPHFNQDNLISELAAAEVTYLHMENLGGRRKVIGDISRSRWRNVSFQAYANYMESTEFSNAVHQLESLAMQAPTAFMCSEAVWWRCHRALVSDYLKARGWEVHHIMAENKFDRHPYTSPAQVTDGVLSYNNPED